MARGQDLDRAADRQRLLLRHRVSRRRPRRGRPGADRGADGRAHQGGRALRAPGPARLAGRRPLPRAGPGLQGRADRGPDPRRGCRDRLALPERPLRGPLSRPARPVDGPDRRLQADLRGGRLLARRRDPADAHPRLRHGVPRQEGSRAAPGAPRAGSRARPSQARPGARSLPVPPRGTRDAVLAPAGHRLPPADRGRGPQAAGRPRLLGDQDASGARRRALAPLGALGQLQGEHVLHGSRRAREQGRAARVRAQADELPGRLPRLRLGPALLPRAAAASRRVRPGLTLRARGRAARPAPGPRLHPGRRARLLHARPGHRRGRLDLRRHRRAV